jgi:hypothetical protein
VSDQWILVVWSLGLLGSIHDSTRKTRKINSASPSDQAHHACGKKKKIVQDQFRLNASQLSFDKGRGCFTILILPSES